MTHPRVRENLGGAATPRRSIRLSRTYCVDSVESLLTVHFHRPRHPSPSQDTYVATRVIRRCQSGGHAIPPQYDAMEFVESFPTVPDSRDSRGIVILTWPTYVAHRLKSVLPFAKSWLTTLPVALSFLPQHAVVRDHHRRPLHSMRVVLYQDSRLLQPRSQHLHRHIRASGWKSVCDGRDVRSSRK